VSAGGGPGQGFAVAAIVFVAAVARADDTQSHDSSDRRGTSAEVDEDAMPPPGYLPGHRERIGLGLSPHAPGEQSVLPGGIAPSFGAPHRPSEGAKFDFHGYLQVGARAGLGRRESPTGDQSSTTWHSDPLVPRGNVFENTNNVPYTWTELKFSYSVPKLTGTVSLAAGVPSESLTAAGTFAPNQQMWIRDAFLTYVPTGLDPLKLSWNLGVYEDRYGAMAQYSNGQYGTPVVGAIGGVGETLSARLRLGRGLGLLVEHGFKGSLARPPAGVPTGPANNWPKPWEGQTFVHHAHVGLDVSGVIQPTFHYIAAFARDDQADAATLGSLRAGYQQGTDYPELSHADGTLTVLGGDVRFALRKYGFLVLAISRVSADHVRTVSGVLQILGAGGGRDLMDRYFGRNNDQGHGSLFLAGAEYNLSLGELLRAPDDFWGEGPDLKVSLFGLYGRIRSDDPARDGEEKYKFGVETTYSALSWLAAAARFDRSTPYVNPPKVPLYANQNDNSYSVATLKAIFRSDWLARESLTLQYSRYVYRSQYHLVALISQGSQISAVSDLPDEHLIALYGNFWW
jgi:hypothetical protein